MKQVYLIPMSRNEKDNETKINEAIYKIGKKVLIRRSIFEAYLREQRKI